MNTPTVAHDATLEPVPPGAVWVHPQYFRDHPSELARYFADNPGPPCCGWPDCDGGCSLAEPEGVVLAMPEPEVSEQPSAGRPVSTTPDVVEMVRVIADAVGDRHAYTAGRGWYFRADGGLWTHDPEGLALRGETFRMVEGVARKRMRSTTGRIATELEPLLVYSGGWDADPRLCGLPDGRVLDLGTGAKRPARPEDRITRRLGAVPDGDCPRPAWERVLDHVSGGDDAARAWLRRFAGASLVGDTREHRFAFLVGPAGGGKSTLVETLRLVAGGYAAGVPEDLFVDGPSRHREAIARLEGARMLVVADLPGTSWACLGLLKALTAGDVLTANHMRRGSFDFRPVGSLWICGNHRPRIPRGDSGLRRRMVVVPVPRLSSDPDPDLPETLRAELPGIASWAVEGAGDYLESGLGPVPNRWAQAADEYHEAEDVVAGWFATACVLEADAFTPSRDLVASFNATTGAHLRRATQLIEWLTAEHEQVTQDKQRPEPGMSATTGVAGLRLR